MKELEKRVLVDFGLMVALMNATIEQAQMLNMSFKHDHKRRFEAFKSSGENFVKHINKTIEPQVEPIIEEAKDSLHDALHEIRKLNGL